MPGPGLFLPSPSSFRTPSSISYSVRLRSLVCLAWARCVRPKSVPPLVLPCLRASNLGGLCVAAAQRGTCFSAGVCDRGSCSFKMGGIEVSKLKHQTACEGIWCLSSCKSGTTYLFGLCILAYEAPWNGDLVLGKDCGREGGGSCLALRKGTSNHQEWRFERMGLRWRETLDQPPVT